MMITTGKRAANFSLILFLSLLPAASVFSERIELPQSVFYYRPAASVFGSEAAWVNPAALGRYGVQSYQFIGEYLDGRVVKSWGLVSSGERLATAYRKIENPGGTDFKEYVLALGTAFGARMHMGGSYRYFKDGPGIFDNRHFWNFALTGSSGPNFRWGAVFSNLNRGRINGVRSETEQRYSASLRLYDDLVTISADMFLSTDTRLSNADFVYDLELRPRPGLFITAQLDSDRNFRIGLRANLLRYFVGSQSRFNRGGKGRGSIIYAGYNDSRQPSLIAEPRRRLGLRVRGSLSENPPQPIFGRKRMAFTTLITGVYRAASDPSISEIIVRLDGLSIGFGRAQELRAALKHFSEQGKKVSCHIRRSNNLGYYVASVADEILISPVSQLSLVGLKAELTFYAGTLEKFGIKADMMRIGKYKTATEMFNQRQASDENREQINRLLDNLYDLFVSDIAEGRNLSRDSVRRVIDNGPFTSAEALKYGLVDGLSYLDDLKDSVLSDLPEVSFGRYLVDTLADDSWKAIPVLAIVVAEGEIRFDRASGVPFGSDQSSRPASLSRAFADAGGNKNVKGIVFRINSPGGYALAAEDIFHAAAKSAIKKPVVVSMANVAASGGYHIASAAKTIFSNSATITGSIGIFGGKADFSSLHKKLDIGKELFTRGKYAGMLTSMRPFTVDERAKYFSHLKAFYDHFIEVVAESRSLTIDSVDNLGQGRVWTGREGMANGLVDYQGGVVPALEYLSEELSIEDYRVVIYPRKRPLFILPASPLFRMLASIFSSSKIAIDEVEQQLGWMDGEELILERLPYELNIE